MFETDTYAVLDVPEPFASAVMAIRVQHRDDLRSALPAEITVAGSSGVGEFEPGQNPDEVFATLDHIARDTAPIEASFGSTLRFPGTDIFVLTLEDEQPFEALHRCIAKSGIRFKSCPFGFMPHCTLTSRSPISDDEANDLLRVRIPGKFVLDTLSVITMPPPMPLLHRVKLTGSN